MEGEADMKLFITGGSGRVGGALCERAIQKGWEVCSNYHSYRVIGNGVTFIQLDISKREEVRSALESLRPDRVIHAAAIAQENEPSLLQAVNVEGTRNIAECCADGNIYMAYVSTDLAFDGNKGNYSEDDTVSPAGGYPASKVKGEQIVSGICRDFSILRIAVNYGWSRRRNTFLEWLLSEAFSKGSVNLFTDQKRSLISLPDLAGAILEALSGQITGVMHLGGPEALSRYDFGLKAARWFSFPEEWLVPVTMEQVQYVGSRCHDCSLDSTRAGRLLGTVFHTVDEALQYLSKEPSGQSFFKSLLEKGGAK
jgi:dTDP-4-dehydrorhamnose reductase